MCAKCELDNESSFAKELTVKCPATKTFFPHLLAEVYCRRVDSNQH